MKKHLFIIIILLISMLGFIGKANALTYARITNQQAVLRTGPGSNYSKGNTLYYNDVVPLVSVDPYKNEKGCAAGWYKAKIDGKIQYLCVSDTSKMSSTIRTTSSTNMRTGAGTNYSANGTIANNKILTLLQDAKVSGKGCTGGWYKVSYNWNTLYVCSNYVTGYNSKSNAIVSNKGTATLREKASNTSKQIAKIKYGQAISLHNTTKYPGAGCAAGWYQVYYGGKLVYACSRDVVTTYQVGSVNDLSGVNIRKSASSSSASMGILNYMDEVVMDSAAKYKGSGCDAGWYKISYNWDTGYVCSSYVTMLKTAARVKRNDALINSDASFSSSKLANIKENQLIWLDGINKYVGNKSGCGAGWYKVNVNGRTAYMCSDYIDYSSGVTSQLINNSTNSSTTTTNTNTNTTKTTSSVKTSSGYYYTTNKWSYRVKEDYGYVRGSASTSGAYQTTLYLGTEVEVLGTSASNSGCSAGWYKIKYYNNKTGYICKSLIEKYEDVTKNDSAYCNTLKAAGFPESYCPYLSYLHSKHPNWKFKAEKTNLTFLAAVNGESNKNYTLNSTSAYVTSSTIREAGGWRTASDGYVAYMLDPRNYLNEQNIFAFEHLGYDSTFHTTSAIRSIVSGTYLDNNTYANYFLNAGKTYKVSPVHLASRVKQEGGSNSSYTAVSGNVNSSCTVTAYVCSSYIKLSGNKGTINEGEVNLRDGAGTNYSVKTQSKKGESFTLASTSKYSGSGCSSGWYKVNITRSLKGIYNYYNIGAYGSNPVMRGLQAAAGCVDYNEGTPWDSREKAIKYGASFIANGYIGKGQDTMYYQKFNTSPNSKYNKYTHQYMTNILAPASESLSTYNSYNNLKLIDKGYVFKIPVYNSMPSGFTTHPPVK